MNPSWSTSPSVSSDSPKRAPPAGPLIVSSALPVAPENTRTTPEPGKAPDSMYDDATTSPTPSLSKSPPDTAHAKLEPAVGGRRIVRTSAPLTPDRTSTWRTVPAGAHVFSLTIASRFPSPSMSGVDRQREHMGSGGNRAP